MLDPASPIVAALVFLEPLLFALAVLWPVVILGLAMLDNDMRHLAAAVGDRLRRLKRRVLPSR